MRTELPYGNIKIELDLPDSQVLAVCEPREMPGVPDAHAELERALDWPIGGCGRLEEIAKGRRTAAVVVDDVTRPVPYPLVLRPVIERLVRGGIALDSITVIVATGLHRACTEDEMAGMLGEYAGRVRIISHDADNANGLVDLCTTSLGTRIRINRRFFEADLKVLTGDVDYHQFCGYGGGSKSVYPGLVDRQGVETNHSRMEIPGTGPGRIDGNPVRQEIDEVGRAAKVDFILNIVQNSNKEIVSAFAGDLIEAHRAGAELVDRMYRVQVERAADAVIISAGGYPKDIDLYQSQKALAAAYRVLKPGGKVFLVAECREGHGSERFDQWMNEAYSLDDIIARIREKFIMGGHKAYQFARDISKGKVFLLSSLAPGQVRKYFMSPLSSPEQITNLLDADEVVIVMPHGSTTVAEVAQG